MDSLSDVFVHHALGAGFLIALLYVFKCLPSTHKRAAAAEMAAEDAVAAVMSTVKASAAADAASDTTDATTPDPHDADLKALKWLYLVPYVLALSSDWIQGPYQFKVYLEYGLDEGQIGVLYICGFGSSMVCGTYTAALMDRWGRRTGCLLYCLVCSLSCLTKNSGNYSVLMFGRVLGGIAASLLFAVFESWCVTKAGAMDIPQANLSTLFSTASFFNGLTAILSAVLGHSLVIATGSVVAPFNAVPVILAICAYLISTRWDENYGGDERTPNSPGSFTSGVKYVLSVPKVTLLGAIGSLFDAAVYVFIFMWTLSLDARAHQAVVPYGLAFAVFMQWCMVGALLVELVLARYDGASAGRQAAKMIAVLVVLAGVGLLPGLTPESSFQTVFNGFCLMELAFGAFMPLAAYLRSMHLSDKNRTAATALYRVPTNVAVCGILFSAGSLSERAKFGLCICILSVALLSSLAFLHIGGGVDDESRNAHCDVDVEDLLLAPSVVPHAACDAARGRRGSALPVEA